jgi:hypothetical protein
MIITFATHVTPENIEAIIADAAKFDLNVDYLQDTVDFNADLGFEKTYAILSVNHKIHQATFTEMVDADFENNWHFCNGFTHGPYWKEVRLNKPKPR